MAWSNMTLEDIRLEIREELGEADDETDPLWSNSYINTWINRYGAIVVENLECIESFGEVTTVDGTVNYDLPENIFKPKLVKREDITLTPISIYKLSNISITSEGAPTKYLIWDSQIYLYSVPDDTYTISVWGYAYPEYMDEDADELPVEREVIEIIIKLVLARCQAKDQEYGVSNQYRAQVPYDVSDYLTKKARNNEQQMPGTVDVMGYGSNNWGAL